MSSASSTDLTRLESNSEFRGAKKFHRFGTEFDHEILSQRGLVADVNTPRNDSREASMPFLFWMPMIMMRGLWQITEDDMRAFFPQAK